MCFYVHFAECPDQEFGLNCTGHCHCKDGLVCDKTTGQCPSGCAAGYSGEDCSQSKDRIVAINYVTVCLCCNCVVFRCVWSVVIMKFIRVNVTIFWVVCQDNKFGENCAKRCHCQSDEPCDVTTGECTSGCASGWHGSDCQTREKLTIQQ